MIVRDLPPFVGSCLRGGAAIVRTTLLVVRWNIVGLLILAGSQLHLEVWSSVLLGLATLAVLSPQLWAHYVFEPLGMWRSAWVSIYLAYDPWRGDAAAGALVAAGRAALASPRRESAASYLRAALRRAPHLDGGYAVAAAVLALVEGRLARARQLLSAVDRLDPAAVPPRAMALSREWMALDAAERGDWAETLRWSEPWPGRGRRTRLTCFVSHLARLVLSGRRSRVLWLSWLCAPRRRANRAAIQRFEQPETQAEHSVSTGGGEALLAPESPGAAFGVLVRRLGDSKQPELSPEGVRAAVTAAGLVADDPALSERARARARVLGIANRADSAVAEFRAGLTREVADLALRSGSRLAELSNTGPYGAEIAAIVRDRLMSEVEEALEALEGRICSDRRLPPADELYELERSIEIHQRVVERGGDEIRYLLWPVLHRVGCDYGVWLHDHPRHRVTGNAVFRYLLGEATELDDESAIDLQSSNVRVGW